ncbi:MAG: helix-hairpin-helix domain-containing protein [Myxococcales bacterium]|nr:helix-hairpin-helix domain-containing protein [Myxococcales bacterium]
MQDSRPLGALGLVLVTLSLSTLATTSSETPAPPARPEPHAPRSLPKAASGNGALASLREGGRIDANRATTDELQLLPGIGPRLAERIVRHRGEHGPFADIAGLRAVSGIGPRTLARLAPMLEVSASVEVEEDHDATRGHEVERVVVEGGEAHLQP